MAKSRMERIAALAPLPLRIILGIIMIAHGHQKVFGEARQGFEGAVESLGVPEPGLVARLVSFLEFVGGLALIAGFLTRPIALLFSGQFLFIVFRMKWSKGLVPGYEYDLALLGSFLTLAMLGGGAGSLDEVLWQRDNAQEAARERRLRRMLRSR
ncbi:MAG: DoxX family protein [Sphaerobacter sp.]|nr:DoxX family protein [Sphaerobacter sp.]